MSKPTRPLPAGIRRAQRVARLALDLVEIETRYVLTRRAHVASSEATKRDAADAVVDYLRFNWDGYVPSDAPETVYALSMALHPEGSSGVAQSQARWREANAA